MDAHFEGQENPGCGKTRRSREHESLALLLPFHAQNQSINPAYIIYGHKQRKKKAMKTPNTNEITTGSVDCHGNPLLFDPSQYGAMESTVGATWDIVSGMWVGGNVATDSEGNPLLFQLTGGYGKLGTLN